MTDERTISPEEEQATLNLKAAAEVLRDCELAKMRAVAAYQEALDTFNRIVAPIPPLET